MEQIDEIIEKYKKFESRLLEISFQIQGIIHDIDAQHTLINNLSERIDRCEKELGL